MAGAIVSGFRERRNPGVLAKITSLMAYTTPVSLPGFGASFLPLLLLKYVKGI
jgi:hypothetical protein